MSVGTLYKSNDMYGGVFVQAVESLDISESLEVTAMTSKEKERVPFDTPMQASGTAAALAAGQKH